MKLTPTQKYNLCYLINYEEECPGKFFGSAEAPGQCPYKDIPDEDGNQCARCIADEVDKLEIQDENEQPVNSKPFSTEFKDNLSRIKDVVIELERNQFAEIRKAVMK